MQVQETLRRTAAEWLQIELTGQQLEQFETYFRELTDWNARMNLTAITDYEAVQVRHFLDSLTLAAPALRGDPPDQPFDIKTARLIDIGAGAGFPGFPLKILHPGLKLTLVDSVGKKTLFLSHLAVQLGFSDVQVLTGRAEELGQQSVHREKYDLATGRAVAAWPVLAEYCLPLCRVGGLFIAPKKGQLSTELAASAVVADLLGARLRSTPTFQLPTETEADPRQLIVSYKISRTNRLYPRRTGLPTKQPLGSVE